MFHCLRLHGLLLAEESEIRDAKPHGLQIAWNGPRNLEKPALETAVLRTEWGEGGGLSEG